MITQIQMRYLVFLLVLFPMAGCAKKEPLNKELHISGTIQMDPSLKNKTSKEDTIFLIAKPAPGGPPVAVVKLMGNDYPYPFHLTKENLMTPDSPLEAPLNLTVRVDKDGDASTKTPGDLFGTYEKNPVPMDERDIVIKVQEVLKP